MSQIIIIGLIMFAIFLLFVVALQAAVIGFLQDSIRLENEAKRKESEKEMMKMMEDIFRDDMELLNNRV